MTNPSPTLARIQAEHPKWCFECAWPWKTSCEREGHIPAHLPGPLLIAAITAQDRQLAERDEDIARLKVQLGVSQDNAVYLVKENARLREQLAEVVHLLTRYRNETPLGHQPHMIAHVVDAALARQEQRRNNSINPNRNL